MLFKPSDCGLRDGDDKGLALTTRLSEFFIAFFCPLDHRSYFQLNYLFYFFLLLLNFDGKWVWSLSLLLILFIIYYFVNKLCFFCGPSSRRRRRLRPW